MTNPISALRQRLDLARKYQVVFDTPVGREVLAHICRDCFVFTTTFVAGDPHQTALREGQRRAALAILKALSIDTIEKLNNLENYNEHSTDG